MAVHSASTAPTVYPHYLVAIISETPLHPHKKDLDVHDKGVAGAGQPPSLLVVATSVPNHFDYRYISSVSVLTQFNSYDLH